MSRICASLCLAVAALALLPQLAAAGGAEFPGGGTRELGRGATGFTRADDPTLMLRNPALLADLWDDQAMAGVNVLLAHACFHASGGYGVGIQGSDVSLLGGKEVYRQAPAGATDLQHHPISGYYDEAYPNVCYQGPTPVFPSIALTKKLASNVGVGLGFFPPDVASLPQWGNPDGTVNTPNGVRPSPTRYFDSHLNTSFFSALGAVGYRPTNWLRLGAGFQWSLLAFNATVWARPSSNLESHSDVRTEAAGRDLFIPGIIASAQIVPTDNLDFAVGFKWSDRVDSKAKLDLTTGAFGTGRPFYYLDKNGTMHALAGTVPTTSSNQQGAVSAPPIWVPQLSFGARYAQRITPRATTKTWEEAHGAAGADVQDHMATERWDIEANAIVYFNSFNNRILVTTDAANAAMVTLVDANPNGTTSRLPAYIGNCVNPPKSGPCVSDREVSTELRGNTQLSLRVGGDYNILPGVLAVRAGLSYENNGADVQYLNVERYMLGRTGLHAGATWRIAKKTDFSIGFAHFIQRDVRLDPNPNSAFPAQFKTAQYNVLPGAHDGVARFTTSVQNAPGIAVNAGSFFYHLQVISVQLAQHF
ncbi:MAG TPA: hypothetical protein VF331_24950 [Polyangiales bacterium]